MTYGSATTSGAATTSSATAAAASGSTVTSAISGTLGAAAGALSVSFRSAGELDRDLALEDRLSVEFSDGAVGLGGGRERDEGVANGA